MEAKAYWMAQLRALPGKIPRIVGRIPYGKESENLGGFVEVLRSGCFSESLKTRDVVALWSHDHSRPLASTTNGSLRLRDTSTALEVEMDLDLDISWHADAYRSIKSGILKGLSFGFEILKEAWSAADLREIIKGKLLEISPVQFPAYPQASVSARNKTQMNEERKAKEMEATKIFFSNDARPTRQKTSGEFRHNLEFVKAVIEAGNMTDIKRDIDPRLLRAATGLGETVASDGGFLAPDALRDSLLYGDDSSKLKPLCDNYRITGAGSSVHFPLTDETSRVSGSQLGGLAAEWLYENKGMTYVTPSLRGLSLSLKKLGALIPASDELFESGSIAEAYIKNVGRRSLAYSIDRAIFRGTGAGQPLGILNAACTIEVAAEVGQSVDTLNAANVRNMLSRLPAESFGRAVWLANPELLEMALTDGVGTGGGAAGLITFDGGVMRMAGHRLIPFEHCSKPGDVGDVCLADLSQFVWVDRQIRGAASIHILFDTDQSLFRLIYRCDGEPAWSRAIVPAFSSTGRTISPFIVMGAR